MFARPRIRKDALRAPPLKRKREHAVEEISFDPGARSDYLTGFHKRKLERIKHAREIAAEKARQDRIEFRKQLREERQQAVEKHVQNVHALLAEAKKAGQDDDVVSDADSQAEGWAGIKDEKSIEPIDHTEEYIDEDRYTSVAIEAVNIDREGIHKAADDPDQEQETDEQVSGEAGKPKADQANQSAKKRPTKKRKKKFRYEKKYERSGGKRKSKSGLRAPR